MIVTRNLKDFPSKRLEEYSIEAQSADDFVMGLLESAPEIVRATAEMHRQSLKNPPKTVQEYLITLKLQGLVRVVPVLRTLLLRLAT